MTITKPRKRHLPTSAVGFALHRIVRWFWTKPPIPTKLQKMNELKIMMEFWHKQESESWIRAREAAACENFERWKFWVSRAKEARARCNKDFREPMKELTGNPDLFKVNVSVHQIRPTQRTFTTSITLKLPVNELPTSAVGFGCHDLFCFLASG